MGHDPALEVLVVGGGTAGIAAAWSLARRGVSQIRVLERYEHVHSYGSHGGFTRIFRHAYHEGSDYVRLVSRADELWMELESRADATLLDRCGLLEFGPPEDPEFAAATRALAAHQIRHERVDARDAMKRWPLTIPEHWSVTFSPDSGYLRVRACLDAMWGEALAGGARFEYGVRVRELIRGGDRPGVLLDDGTVIKADRVVVAPGAFVGTLLPELSRRSERGALHAQRRVLLWTLPAPEARDALAQMPVWAAFTTQGFFYGFPFRDEGVQGFKLAVHTSSALPELERAVDPERVDRSIHERDLEPLRAFLDRHIPSAAGAVAHTSVCMYGSSVDGDFVLDHHPDDPRIVVAAGFSGHGFKFAPLLGEIAADLLMNGDSRFRLRAFTL